MPRETAGEIQIDRGYQDDGLYAITLYFDETDIPCYITLARDEYEEPDDIYFEAEDQIYSFKSKHIQYTLTSDVLTIDLARDSLNRFFWTSSESVEITCKEHADDLNACPQRIFEIGRNAAC